MKAGKRHILKRYLRLIVWPLFTPAGFVLRAAILTVVFLTAHLAGLRDYMSLISGMLPESGVSYAGAALFCGIYMFLYFAFILVVPVLLIGSMMFFVLLKFFDTKTAGKKT